MLPFFLIAAPELLIPGRLPPGTDEVPELRILLVTRAPLEFDVEISP